MVSLVVSFFVAAYILFAIVYVVLKKIFSKKPKAWLNSLIFFILFPTWDVLIAFIIYIPAALFWSGDTIHQKVKTDTVNYDVYYKTWGVAKSTQDDFFYKGFKYVEVELIDEAPHRPPRGLYRYWLDKDRNIKYKKIPKVNARYTIKEKMPIDFYIVPIVFRKRVIIDRQENKIIASSRSPAVSYLHFFKVPFFNWLRWYKQGKNFVCSNRYFYDIHIRVINTD